MHAVPRLLRGEGANGDPCRAVASLLAGSRHANYLARAVVYRVLSKVALQAPRANPGALCDDVSAAVYGSASA
eukprot:8868772-Pyramimonas_sp.AAC.1